MLPAAAIVTGPDGLAQPKWAAPADGQLLYLNRLAIRCVAARAPPAQVLEQLGPPSLVADLVNRDLAATRAGGGGEGPAVGPPPRPRRRT